MARSPGRANRSRAEVSDQQIKQKLQEAYPQARIRKQGNDWLVSWVDITGWHGLNFNGQKVLALAAKLA